MSLVKKVKLNTGAEIPIVGLGTWRSGERSVYDSVLIALNNGYRAIDCAYIYENEKEVGKAIKDSGIPRSELFITTKLWNTFHEPKDVPKGLEISLKNLGLNYVDLYLMHWPCGMIANEKGDFLRDDKGKIILSKTTFVDTYKAMEKLLETGKVKAIGISNFNIKNLTILLESGIKVVPAMNQIELHPYLPQQKLVDLCRSKGIQVTAYSPLGSTGDFNLRDDPIIVKIAKDHNAMPAQVLVTWAVKRGTIVIPKSTKKERIINNIKLVEITDAEFDEINSIKRRERFCDPAIFWGQGFNDLLDN